MTPAALTSDAIKTKGPGAVASVELALSDSVLGLHLGTAGWYLLKRQILMFWAQSHILSYQRYWNTWKLTSDADKVSVDTLLCSHSVVSNSLQPRGLQHARPLCPPLSPGVCSDSCPLNQRCYLTISSSVTLFSCFQYFQASGSFLMSRLFTSGGQSIGASALASVLPMKFRVDFL